MRASLERIRCVYGVSTGRNEIKGKVNAYQSYCFQRWTLIRGGQAKYYTDVQNMHIRYIILIYAFIIKEYRKALQKQLEQVQATRP